MWYIGIDIHKRTHEIVVLDDVGKPCGRSIRIHNTRDDLELLFNRIQALNSSSEALRFGIEATGHYWLALYSHLRADGQEVAILNPLRTHAYRARSVRPAKHDRIDARCIAEIIRTDSQSDYRLDDEALLGLRQLTRLRVKVVDLVSDRKRRLLSLLDQVFPEFETLFGEKYCKSSLALLQAYPTPADILSADQNDLTTLMEQHSRKYYERTKAEAISRRHNIPSGYHSARKPIAPKSSCIAGQITYREAQLKQLDQEINAYLAGIPNYLTTVSGIGPILAASILGEIGDIRRFKNAKALVAYAGVDPGVRQSGEFTAKKAHLSKRGSTHLRRAIWLAAAAATRHDPA